ncbi:ABC transporter permease [Streptomyces sp. TP-A0874]|uniref:ABC transporter permease n=1 Tax=Streptomyces sp. TP-A0874 TaxID=549819 RepID=UPI000853794C|nr:ABC transporter permease [Streptomyces sp. TP-A0874]
MSATTTVKQLPNTGTSGRRKLSPAMVLLIVAAGLLALSAVRAVAGTNTLTSSALVAGALQLAVPIGMAGLGGLWAERAGVINIGLEGMMILGTFFGAWAGWQTSPWIGLLAGVLGGVLGGAIHAIATVTFGVDHIVSGVAINILALGVTSYLAKISFTTPEAAARGGSPRQSPASEALPTVTVPGLSDGLATIEGKHWFLISDTAGILGGLVTDLSLITILAVGLIVGSYFVLWRTSFGLRLRSCGENPTAAESLGVNVYTYKYAAVLISGGLAGLGGAFLSLVSIHIYNEGQTGGRGYIGLAAMIFGNWRPGGLAMGAGLFGFTDALQLRGGGSSLHALLLLLAVVTLGLAVWKLYRKRYAIAAVNAGIGAVLVFWYVMTDELPGELVRAAPYITTLLVLALFAQRLRLPAAIGKAYRKGQGK